MLVYGDQDRIVTAAEWLSHLREAAALLGAMPGGLDRHAALVRLFVDMAGLLQAVADEDFRREGHDEQFPLQSIILSALTAVARGIDRSWRTRFADQEPPPPLSIDAATLPSKLTIRRCEGFAYYAIYPEQVLAAARSLPPGSVVVGLRSIGAALAALAAAASDAALTLTVRPTGPVFARTLALGPVLEPTIRANAARTFAIVDEGPGLSGSSFGGAADVLEGLGVARERIVFLPGHAGDPGPHADAAHRSRWAQARRPLACFEETLLAGDAPLAEWFADLTGPALKPLEDLSGGRWRNVAARDAPSDPGREARKYLLTTASGAYLLKFAGLDDIATAKFDRARRLYEAGFCPEPLALRYGFLLERWTPAPSPALDAEIVPELARYLAFRAQVFAASAPGASLRTLVAMGRNNAREALGEAAAALFDGWSADCLDTLQHHVRPVHVDARLHRWEWLDTPDGLRKTDAVDHSQAHDLIGCQDIAWDIAGAAVEFDLDDARRDSLTAAVCADRPEAAALVALLEPCYLAFQIGWWSFAPPAGGTAERARYETRLRRLIAGRGEPSCR